MSGSALNRNVGFYGTFLRVFGLGGVADQPPFLMLFATYFAHGLRDIRQRDRPLFLHTRQRFLRSNFLANMRTGRGAGCAPIITHFLHGTRHRKHM